MSLHYQKLRDFVPELKQATDKESRNAENNGGPRGGFRGGYRGRGGFAARGLSAAGLTRGTGFERKGNGDAPSGGPPKPSEGS